MSFKNVFAFSLIILFLFALVPLNVAAEENNSFVDSILDFIFRKDASVYSLDESVRSVGIEPPTESNIMYGDGYSIVGNTKTYGIKTYLRQDGIWRPFNELEFGTENWTYLVEELNNSYRITADNISFKLSKETWIDYDFRWNIIKETINIPSLQALLDRSIVHNETVRYMPLEWSPSQVAQVDKNVVELGIFKSGDFWIRDAGIEVEAYDEIMEENYTYTFYDYYDVENHYELQVINGEIRLYFDDLDWFKNANYPLIMDPTWIIGSGGNAWTNVSFTGTALGDGDIDVVGSLALDSKITFYTNDGSQTFGGETVFSGVSPYYVHAIDFDLDGDLDVVYGVASGDEVAWLENDGSESFTQHAINSSITQGLSTWPIDLDSDGDLDVVAGAYSGGLYWFENDGAMSFTGHLINASISQIRTLYPDDVDGDGYVDIITGSRDGDYLCWLENDGSQSFTYHEINGTTDGLYKIFYIDMDGDGIKDVVNMARDGDLIEWHKNDGNEAFTWNYIYSADGPHSLFPIDLDYDGNMDVVACFGLSTNDTVWLENDGSENFAKHDINASNRYPWVVLSLDLDQDGYLDVLSGVYADNTINWYKNDGAENFAYNEINDSATGVRFIDAADFGNDYVIASKDYLTGYRTNVNLTSWYDAGANYQVESIGINFSFPATGTSNASVYLCNNDTGAVIETLASHTTTEVWSANFITPMQNARLNITLFSETNITPRIDNITYYYNYSKPIVNLLSQDPSELFENSTGTFNVSFGITHSSSGLNNSSMAFIYSKIDDEFGSRNWSARPPVNNRTDGLWRADSRNGTIIDPLRLTFEDNTTILSDNVYEWAGGGYLQIRMTIERLNDTYSIVMWNGTIQDTVASSSWDLDRTELENSSQFQYEIYKSHGILIKDWDIESIEGHEGYLINPWFATSKSPVLTPTKPLEIWLANESYDLFGAVDIQDSPYATLLSSKNYTQWTAGDYKVRNSSYINGIYANQTVIENLGINVTDNFYLFITSETSQSKPYMINLTNSSSSTNISFANTNTTFLEAIGGGAPFRKNSTTVNSFTEFKHNHHQIQYKLFVNDSNGNWGNSSLITSSIGDTDFAPSNPTIYDFAFPTNDSMDRDMNNTYGGTFNIGIYPGLDPDGQITTHNLTLHYGNGTYIATINNTFVNDTGLINISFDSTSYYSDTYNYTLKCIANDSTKTSETWLGVNFTLSGIFPATPINLADTTGNFWVNYTWEADNTNNESYSITDSFNVSVNNTNWTDWYNTSWDSRQLVTIAHINDSGEALTNYPAYLNVTIPIGTQIDLDDIVFTDSSNNIIPYELENYTSEYAHYWVNITSLETDGTNIYMYWDNDEAVDQSDAEGVWDSNYVGVWHFSEGTGTTVADSTRYGNDGTFGGTNPYNWITGQIGYAGNFSPDHSSYVDCGNHASLNITDEIGIVADVKFNILGGSRVIVGKYDWWGPYYFSTSGSKLLCRIGKSDSSTQTLTGVVSLSVNEWYQIVFVAKANDYLRTYIDGDLDKNQPTGYSIGLSTGKLIIGKNSRTDQYFTNGTIDEVRISNVTRSEDYHNQSYQLTTNQSDFVTFGDSIINGWINGTQSPLNISTEPHGWVNISVYSYNNTYGTLCIKPISDTVQVPNNAPVLTVTTTYTVAEGETVSIVDTSTSDADSDTPTYYINRSDLFADFDTATGLGTWTTGITDFGIYHIDLGVSDGWAGEDNATLIITVIDSTPTAPSNIVNDTSNNFWINWSWTEGTNIDYTNVWINNSDVENSEDNIYNGSYAAHAMRIISLRSYNSTSGEYSAWLNQTTTIPNNAPTAPTDTTDLSMHETDNTPSVSWTASTDADGDTITYYVESKDDSDVWAHDYGDESTSCLLDAYIWSDGETGYWRVKAYDGYVNSSWAPSDAGDEFRMNTEPTATSLTTEGETNPTDVEDSTPDFAWTYADDESDTQSHYQVYVGLEESAFDMWNSGQVVSSLETAVYAGDALSTGITYYVQVRVKDGYEFGEWETGTFELIEPNTYNVSGYTINETGYIISGILVSNNITIETDTSNATGYYILESLENDTYRLTASKTGYVTNSTVIVVVDGADLTLRNITLTATEAEPDAPIITSWYNNVTDDASTNVAFNNTTVVGLFSAVADQDITTWTWKKDGVDQSHNWDNFTSNWTTDGTKTVSVYATNDNGTSNTITWIITIGAAEAVDSETIMLIYNQTLQLIAEHEAFEVEQEMIGASIMIGILIAIASILFIVGIYTGNSIPTILASVTFFLCMAIPIPLYENYAYVGIAATGILFSMGLIALLYTFYQWFASYSADAGYHKWDTYFDNKGKW